MLQYFCMKTLVHIYWREGRVNVRRLAGIHQYTSQHNMRVTAIGMSYLGIPLADALDVTKPDGVILEESVASKLKVRTKDLRGIPVVVPDFSDELAAKGFTGVRQSGEAAQKAVEALLLLDFDNYAYVGIAPQMEWTIEREQIVRRLFAAAGKRYFPFRNWQAVKHLKHTMAELQTWMSKLPRPCGILAANDRIGQCVLEASHQLGIAIPKTFAVMGIDNEESICNFTFPTLASVSPDFEESGYLAASMLSEMLRDGCTKLAPRFYGSGEVVLRHSMRAFHPHNDVVSKALDLIHAKASDGLEPRDVIKLMGTGVRNAQIRFRRTTGHTIKEEITRTRINRACELLKHHNLDVNYIAKLCGYRTEQAFRAIFLKHTNETPSAWRKSHI